MADPAGEKPKKPEPDLSGRDSFWGKLDAGIRAAANFVTLGYADKLDALLSAGSYKDNMAKNEAINSFDDEHNKGAVLAGQAGIVAVAAVPNLVRGAVVGTVKAGGRALARVTGRSAAAETAVSGATGVNVAAGAVAQSEAVVQSGSLAARAAGAVKNMARGVADTAKAAKAAPWQTTKAVGKAAAIKGIGIATPLVAMPVAFYVADGIIDRAQGKAGEGSAEPDTVAGATAINKAQIQGGAAVVAGATATMAVGAGVKEAFFKLADRYGGRYARLFKAAEEVADSTPGLKKALASSVAGIALSVKSGATTTARLLGLGYIGGEIAASAYASTETQTRIPVLSDATDSLRETYNDLKQRGMDRLTEGTVSGIFVAGGTRFLADGVEGMLPFVSNVVAKEKQILLAKDVNFADPEMVRLFVLHRSSESSAIRYKNEEERLKLLGNFLPRMREPGMPKGPEEWAALVPTLTDAQLEAHPFYQYDQALLKLEQEQHKKLADMDRSWQPALERLDGYLLSGKADLSDPALNALARSRIRDDLDAVKLDSQLAQAAAQGRYDYRTKSWLYADAGTAEQLEQQAVTARASLDVKWAPVVRQLLADPAPAGQPEQEPAQITPLQRPRPSAPGLNG